MKWFDCGKSRPKNWYRRCKKMNTSLVDISLDLLPLLHGYLGLPISGSTFVFVKTILIYASERLT